MKKLLFFVIFACVIGFSSCKKSGETSPSSRGYNTVSTFAGSTTAVSGSTDGTGNAARFNYVGATVQDSEGNLYVTDIGNHTIRKITSAGVVTTFAGTVGVSGGNDGVGASAKFFSPYGLAIDASNNLYVCEYRGHRVRKITPTGTVTTVAGSGTSGSNNGTGASASFSSPVSLALDNAGNLFVADYGNSLLRKIVLATGVVTTFAGGGTQSNAPFDGQGTSAKFESPSGICVDAENNLYAADYSSIRKITPAGAVTTIAGLARTSGFVNGTGNTVRFGDAFGICRDNAGFIYVADRDYGCIRKIAPDGTVNDFVGTTASMFVNGANPSTGGDADGGLTTARFRYLSSLYINSQGIIFVGEEDGHRVRKIE